MIGLAGGRPIFLATGVTDLRRGIAGLYALILEHLAQEPLSGAIYGFCNRRRKRATLCLPPLEAGQP
jgi:transposase